MPAPGEQHLNSGGRTIINPFEEVKPRISEYTAQDIATLQSKLEKQLGPEYISSRQGPGGGKVHYVAAEKCIQLANEVFGFNGWSSQIKEVQVDFVDEHPQTLKVSLGLSVIVRVTLRDGTFHEDIGYGHIENCKGKAAAFEKAKKEGTTDGLKRALRSFGNVLGNCIYDKEYLSKVTKVKVQPGRWDVANLHRHSDHIIKKEPEVQKAIEEKSLSVVTGTSTSAEDALDDEFGDFDDADFSVPDPETHPDEVVLPAPAGASHHFNGNRNAIPPAVATPNIAPQNQNKPPITRQQSMRPPNAAQAANNGPPPQPLTPNSGYTRAPTGVGQMRPPPQDSVAPRPIPGAQSANAAPQAQFVVAGKRLHQPSRTDPPSAPVSPLRNAITSSDGDDALPPPGAGFLSAKTAAQFQETTPGALPPQIHNLPAFNPHADSPSIKKTPGVDHSKTKPLTRDMKHVPGSTQVPADGVIAGSTAGVGARPNIGNSQMAGHRRIGVPPGGSPSPMANRGSYKPPTLKRPMEAVNRAPLIDLPANAGITHGDTGDAKRQRLGA